MNQALEAWASLNQFPETEPHECSSRDCSFFVQLGVFNCPLTGTCLGGGAPAIVRGTRPGRAKTPCHGAAHTPVPGARVVACARTGAAHHCHKDCDRSTVTDDARRVCGLTRAELSDLRGAAHAGWARTNAGKFAMTAVHECTAGCAFVPLELFACPVFGICVGGGVFPLVERNPATNARRLTGAKNRCFGAQAHRHLAGAQLFACLQTGEPHLCGRTCREASPTHAGDDTVCTFTGRVLHGLALVRPKPLPAGCVFQETSDFKTEYVRPAAGSTDIARYYGHVVSGMRKKAGEQVREQLFNALLAFATQYITERACKTNPQRNALGDEAVRDAIEAQCRRKAAPSFQALVHIAAAARSSQPLAVAFRMTEAQARKHAWTVATRIVALMGVLRHVVPGGRAFVDGMSLKCFFLLGVEMCRQGIAVAQTTLLTPDPILVLLSRGDADAAAFWEDRVDARRAPRNLTKMPAQLLQLLSAAVASRHVSPERLRLDEMVDHLHVATEGFEGYRRKE